MVLKSLDRFISIDPQICGGKPCISGRRIPVAFVATWHEKQGLDVPTIAADYDLTPVEIYAALAYYNDHRDEVEAQLREEEQFAEQMKQRTPSLLRNPSDPST